MPYCFVIQPFDGGRFDKRYTDVFKPAIKSAGLEPYRVDRDPSVSIPINEIESGIQGASVCFADITLDNPNVWFELGYALASEKEVCLICSRERQTRFPFDVQHRSIIQYDVDSSSDYHSLQQKITARLAAMEEKTRKLAVISARSLLKEERGLSQHETIVLAAIMENRDGPGDSVSHWILKNDLARMGYNNMALNIGLEKLLSNGMISAERAQDSDGDTFNIYILQDEGLRWLVDNSERLEISAPQTQPPKAPSPELDDEIPF